MIVTPYFAPAWGYGGPPKLLHEFAKAMVERGHRVAVVTTDALDEKRASADQHTLDGITVHRFKNLSNRLAWRQKIFLPLDLGQFLNQTIDMYDFVFCSDLRHPLNILAFRACQAHHTPYGLAAFGELAIPRDWKQIPKKIYDIWYGQPMLRQAKLLFAQTESEQLGYRSMIGEHAGIVLWPLAIDLNAYRQLPPVGQFRKRFGLLPADLITLFVGRIHPYKGLDRLIQAHAELVKILPHLKLVLIGRDDGALADLQTSVAQLGLKQSVIFPGPLYDQEVIAAYQDADVFAITPTHDEQTPLAGIMALAAGCPVVVTQNASIPWLDEFHAGITLDNPKKLTETLQPLLEDDRLRKSMSLAARQLAFERYGWQARAQEFEKLVYKTLGYVRL